MNIKITKHSKINGFRSNRKIGVKILNVFYYNIPIAFLSKATVDL